MPLNLDANASYGLLPGLEEFIREMGLSFLNPSSVHQGGQRAKALLEDARDSIRRITGAPRDGAVVFTSGATEANNTALFSPFWSYLSAAERRSSITPSLVISAVEHPSVLEAARRLEEFGIAVKVVKPRSDHLFYPEDFAAAIEPHTKLVSVMYVNNETGQVLPVREISQAVRAINPNVRVHSDAVQALGKIAVSLDAMDADFISISGHKVGALSGIGALVYRSGYAIDPLIVGGPQEVRRRAGTENIIGAVSFGAAVDLVSTHIDERKISMERYRARIVTALTSAVPAAKINFISVPQVGNTISVQIPGVNTGDLVVGLDLGGVWVSSGSACSSGKPQASETLLAMGLSTEEAQSTIRISVLAEYGEDEFTKGLDNLVQVLQRMSHA